MTIAPPTPTPTPTATQTLTVRVGDRSHPLEYTDSYIDVIWTPLLGATAVALLRICAHCCRLHRGNVQVTVNELANAVGCKPSRVTNQLTRLQHHDLIDIGNNIITLTNGLPAAHETQLARLPTWATEYAINRHKTMTAS